MKNIWPATKIKINAQHTPGPWYVGENRPTGYAHILAPAMERGGPVKIICDMQTYASNHNEDANLIAAAPELLEALEYALKQIEDCAPELVNTQKVLRAAIAKAKGNTVSA